MLCVKLQRPRTTSVNKEGEEETGTGTGSLTQEIDWLAGWIIIMKKRLELSRIFYHWIFSVMILAWKVVPAMLEYFIIFSKWMQGRDV